jgi:hypothetical protein
MIMAAAFFWLLSQVTVILKGSHPYAWHLKADAALCLLAALVLSK